MYCRNCGKELGEEEKYCATCGFARDQGNRFCPNCGKERAYEGARNCTNCGTPLSNNVEATSPTQNVAGNPGAKSRLAAGLLQIFLGSLGIGRFYLGYSNIGVAQLLVSIFTCGIGGIWGFIDGIMIICGSIQVDGYGHPLKD